MLRALACVPAAFCALGVGTTARAATLYWDGGTGNIATNGDGISQGGSGTWNGTLKNWDPGAGLAHVSSASRDSVIFGGTAGTVTLGSNLTITGVTFATDGYTLTGANTLTIKAGGITANGSATINALLKLGTAQSWTTATGKTLTIGGTVNNGGKLLTIARACHNYVWTGDKKKGVEPRTPAMRLGLARAPLDLSDIIYFR